MHNIANHNSPFSPRSIASLCLFLKNFNGLPQATHWTTAEKTRVFVKRITKRSEWIKFSFYTHKKRNISSNYGIVSPAFFYTTDLPSTVIYWFVSPKFLRKSWEHSIQNYFIYWNKILTSFRWVEWLPVVTVAFGYRKPNLTSKKRLEVSPYLNFKISYFYCCFCQFSPIVLILILKTNHWDTWKC